MTFNEFENMVTEIAGDVLTGKKDVNEATEQVYNEWIKNIDVAQMESSKLEELKGNIRKKLRGPEPNTTSEEWAATLARDIASNYEGYEFA